MKNSQALIFSQLKWFKELLFGFFLILLSNINYAKTWIVSNEPNFPADFSDLQACVNAAVNGDIILVQGSANNYGDVEIRKRLIIMGPGYFLSKNPQTQVNLSSAKLNSIFLLNGSMGAIIQGLEIIGSRPIEALNTGYGSLDAAGIQIDSANGMILSCFVHHSIAIKNSVGTLIRKSFIREYIFSWDEVNGCLVDNSFVVGLYVNNTRIKNCYIGLGGYVGGDFKNSVFENNIFSPHVGPNFRISFDDCVFNNNILTNGFLGSQLGSNAILTYPELFIGYAVPGNYSPDGLYQLAPGSPAIGYGTNGIDCGPFGGNDPYKLSGISFHPNIWSVTMPQTATSGEGLKIQIKVNANN
jgi:hypothetical protein